MRLLVGCLVAALLLLTHPAGGAGVGAAGGGESFAAAGRQATTALVGTFYVGSGAWRVCDRSYCAAEDRDWGADSLTDALALRAMALPGQRLRAMLRALAAGAPRYGPPCSQVTGCPSWSDVPEWDAIALADEFRATRDPVALAKAKAAFAFVEDSRAYALGACPAIPYQQPGGGRNHLKTLETEANAVKAALLLYRATGQRTYLAAAGAAYDAARRYFLDRRVALYTVYVFDDGSRCVQLPHRFFASVNGDMIWSGVELSRDTGRLVYLRQAAATAGAVERHLSDGLGVFADLQAENDVVEPLVEGMDALARRGQPAAVRWLLTNASAALSARTSDGSFGRFFDGPPPSTLVTAWQTNGGLALEIAAAALAPHSVAAPAGAWAPAPVIPRQVTTLPATIRFYGSGIALLGTLGERCCEAGHARLLIDGRQTFDHTGIWQDKSSSGRRIPDTILFAWRWRASGMHELTFLPGIWNAKEGGPFLHLVGYRLLR